MSAGPAAVPGVAVVTREGTVRQVNARAEPPEEVTEQMLQRPGFMPRLMMRVLREIAALRRRWSPRHIDFEDVFVVAGTVYDFPHMFGGRVNYWPLRYTDAAPILLVDPSTDDNVLRLASDATGYLTLRVEEAG